MKKLADDKIYVTEKLKFVLGRVENIVGKGENAGSQYFLLFLQCFQKASFQELLKVGIVWKRVKPAAKNIQIALNSFTDGSGMVYGVDISDKMLKEATKSMKAEITAGKVALYPNSVTDLPFNENSMDCIFHCNCYYFWPDMDSAIRELYRVIKHDGVLVTTLNIEQLKEVRQRGIMKYGNIEPSRYMDSLHKTGFVNIKYEDMEDKISGFQLQAITAAACKPVK